MERCVEFQRYAAGSDSCAGVGSEILDYRTSEMEVVEWGMLGVGEEAATRMM